MSLLPQNLLLHFMTFYDQELLISAGPREVRVAVLVLQNMVIKGVMTNLCGPSCLLEVNFNIHLTEKPANKLKQRF